MIATKRPDRRLLLRGVAAYWAASVAIAFVAAYPFSRVLGGTGIQNLPDGDAALFTPGATFLIEALRIGGRELSAALEAAATLAVLGSFAMLLPLSGLMVALCRRGPLRNTAWLARAASHLPAFSLLAGLTVLAEAVTLFLVLSAAFSLRDFAASVWTERGADLVLLACLLLGLLVLFGFEILEDLARAAVVRKKRTAIEALGEGAGVLFSLPLRVLSAWALPAFCFAALVAIGAVLVDLLHVDRPGALRVALVAVVHQGVLLGRGLLRAFWLSRALGLVSDRYGSSSSSR